MQQDELFIGGAWRKPSTQDRIEVISPHTESPSARVAAAGPGDVDAAVSAARVAFDEGPWPRTDPAERVATVRRLAELYGWRGSEVAEVITSEVGAPAAFAQPRRSACPQ